MKRKIVSLALSLLYLNSFGIGVEKLTCEYVENPLGVQTGIPALGWTLSSELQGDSQSAYEIKVASSRSLLQKSKADQWLTGKVMSDQSQHVAYSGKPLEGGKRYYWQVRVWDKAGKPSAWSEINTWTTAIGEKAWLGKWIGAIGRQEAKLPGGRNYHIFGFTKEFAELWDQADPLAKRSIMLRKEFDIEKIPESALIYVCGLGHYDLYINGSRIDNSVFKPLWSDYDKTVYYNTFDISRYLKKGTNVVGVILGNGMYNVTGGRYTKFRVSFGPPTLLLQAQLEYKNGEVGYVLSDDTWKYDLAPATFNCIFGGEDYDANLEQSGWNAIGFDDSHWKKAVVQDAPKGKLCAQTGPAVTVADVYAVKKCKKTGANTFLFDMGQNLSGFPTIKVRGKKGQKIRLLPAEAVNADTTGIIQESSGAPYYFEYTLKGDGVEEWTPMFSYYGYQFIEISGIDYLENENAGLPVLLDLKSNFIHSSAQLDGTFRTSNGLFNRIHYIVDKAMRSNMQAVLTDCPHREKLGWLEEIHLNGPGLLFNYNLRTLYPKIMNDIQDSQLDNGLVPDIAPEYVVFEGGFRDSPEWGAASVIVPWMYYEWYGDDRLVKKYYPLMRKYVDYLTSKSDHYILSHGLGDWYDHGPHIAGISRNTPMGITATGHYYLTAKLLSKTAGMIGDAEAEHTYTALASDIKNAYNTVLFDPDTKQYGNGSQCSNALPLYLDIVPEEYKDAVLNNLVADIEAHGGKLTTGDIGNRYLYQTLSKNGLNELMYRMHNHREIPGYGFQIDLGVTTLTEQWDSRKGMSWNHFMMGQIEEWFYRSLAGINPDIENPGFKHFYICPSVVGDLTEVSATYESMYGTIGSAWKIENGVFSIEVKIPVNTTATLCIPVGDKEKISLGSGVYVFKYDI